VRGNRCDFTLTDPDLHVQTALSRAAHHCGRLPLGTGAAACAASEGGHWRRGAAGVGGRKCLLFFLDSYPLDND
jgi:hypothetical protein